VCGVERFELAGKEKIELDLTEGRGTWLAAGWVMSGVEEACEHRMTVAEEADPLLLLLPLLVMVFVPPGSWATTADWADAANSSEIDGKPNDTSTVTLQKDSPRHSNHPNSRIASRN
jgi:hypothetical protein